MENLDIETTFGLDFLIGQAVKKVENSSPLKRWNMYLRWLVRKDNIDFGRWSGSVDSADLVLPLDTHTFNVCKKLSILKRKSYDLKSAIEITEVLKKIDSKDPIKYDFALYRIGQEKIIKEVAKKISKK